MGLTRFSVSVSLVLALALPRVLVLFKWTGPSWKRRMTRKSFARWTTRAVFWCRWVEGGSWRMVFLVNVKVGPSEVEVEVEVAGAGAAMMPVMCRVLCARPVS
jgi:hypothetical protein